MKYRTLVELHYPTDKDVLRRLRSGEAVTVRERRMKLVLAGEIVSDIPKESIPGLLLAGWIEEVPDGEA